MVRVRDISRDDQGHDTELTGTEKVITFKAFLYTRDKHQLISEVEESGKDPQTGEIIYKDLVGNPNLSSEFRTIQSQKSADHAVELGEGIGQNNVPVRKRVRPSQTVNEVTA